MLVMHRFIRQAQILAAAAVLTASCGGRNQVETPAPNTEVPSAPSVPYSDLTVEPIAKDQPEDNRRATLEERIHFGFDQSDLTPAARQTLEQKAEVLRGSPRLTLRIEGHADERGSDEYNLALSVRRAAAAKRFLVSLGVSADRLETVGYGEEQPLDEAENEAAWATNRRDEFKVSSGALAQY